MIKIAIVSPKNIQLQKKQIIQLLPYFFNSSYSVWGQNSKYTLAC